MLGQTNVELGGPSDTADQTRTDAEQILAMATGLQPNDQKAERKKLELAQKEASKRSHAMGYIVGNHIGGNILPLPLRATWEDILAHTVQRATGQLAVQHGLPPNTTAQELADYFATLIPKHLDSDPFGKNLENN